MKVATIQFLQERTTMLFPKFCAILGCLFLCGCPTRQAVPAALPPLSQTADGSLLLTASGMKFPATVADFERGAITSYRDDGTDFSVAYSLKSPVGRVEATVYVYPAPSLVSVGSPDSVIEGARRTLVRQEFTECKAAVVNHHADATLLYDGDYDLTIDKTTHHGLRAVYTFGANYGGLRIPIRSELYLFCYADTAKLWTVKYRFSYPQSRTVRTGGR